LKHAAIQMMKRRFRWPSRKEVRDTDSALQHNAPLPERRKPCVSANASSSTPSAPNLSAASGQSQASSITNVNATASASVRPNVGHSTTQDGTSSGAIATKKDYWQLAVDQLQLEDSSIADQIAGVRQAAAAGNTDFAAQLLHTTQQGQQELESKRWKISTGSREVVLRGQFDRLVKAITLFKDVGNAAGSIDPLHAGLPLAGFCVLMQVGFVKPSTRSRRLNVLDRHQ
jgi:hypothetical protein